MQLNMFIRIVTSMVIFLSTCSVNAFLDNGAQFTPDGKRIVFHSYRDNAGELWVMNVDGLEPKKITTGNNHDRWPILSTDGQKIVFISRRNGNWDVFSVNLDGSGLQAITKTAVNELGASFSPDGKQIVYAQAGEQQNSDIYLIISNADGSEPKKLTQGVWPIWNTSNGNIVYSKVGESDGGIFIYDMKNKHERKLVGAENRASAATWTYDGKWVYFVQDSNNEKHIFKIKSDGSDITDLGLNAQNDSRPMLSADGHQLVWGHNRHGDVDIFSYNFQLKEETNLTPNSHYQRFPDINHITEAFLISSKRDGNSEVYLMADNKMKNLTHSASEELGGR